MNARERRLADEPGTPEQRAYREHLIRTSSAEVLRGEVRRLDKRLVQRTGTTVLIRVLQWVLVITALSISIGVVLATIRDALASP